MSATKLKSVDIAVIGAGVAGTILCKELAQTGLRVLGLERGRMLDPAHDFAMPYAHDELKYDDRHSDLLQNFSRETITFRNTMQETALPVREVGASTKLGECVGGAGVHWSGGTFRFLPWDFETRSATIARYGEQAIPADCTSQDWGVTYDEMEPYYDQFEHLYGIGGKAGNLNGEIQPGGNPYEGPRSREYPNPANSPTYSSALFAQATKSFGYRPFPRPTAAQTRAYMNPHRLMLGECVRGGFCSGFGCATGAKGSPLSTVLPALLKQPNFELRPHANVIRLNLDSAKQRAVSVTYLDARGREIEQPADLVILAAYAFNNTRLMLLSGIGQPYDPIANRGVVGRNYADQTGDKVSLFFDNKVFSRFMGGGGRGMVIDEFNGDNFDHAGLGFFGGAYIGALDSGGTPISYHPVPTETPRWGSAWKQAAAHYYDRSFMISTHGGFQSYRQHYLDLDPTYRDAYGLPLLRLTLDWQENEKKLAAYTLNKAVEIARSLDAARLNVNPPLTKYNIVSSGRAHNTGGTVMGADPATSAVNKYLQSWDVPNVFVVGGSAFPQNSANNPTGTIGALACWAADAIKDYYLKRPAALV